MFTGGGRSPTNRRDVPRSFSLASWYSIVEKQVPHLQGASPDGETLQLWKADGSSKEASKIYKCRTRSCYFGKPPIYNEFPLEVPVLLM
jgi:hypothetical protein